MSKEVEVITKEKIKEKYLYYINKNGIRKKERWGIDVVYEIAHGEFRGYEQCVDVYKIFGFVYKIQHWAWDINMPEEEKKKIQILGFKNGMGKKSKGQKDN